MRYIILAAGKGTRLNPLTYNYPKCLYKLDDNTSVLQRMVYLIKNSDIEAEIIVIVGFMDKDVVDEIQGVHFIKNPFYEVTNSIASLWFIREKLCEEIVIINGDIVTDEKLIRDIITKPTDRPAVLMDSSIKKDGDYNVQVSGDHVVIMSKEIKNYSGEYAGITKLDKKSALLLKNEIEKMVSDGYYDQWYENALVQLIFRNNFKLHYIDISNYNWTEIDDVNDLVFAKKIHLKDD